MAKTWVGVGSDNSWSTASNWSPSGVPTSGSITVPGGSTLSLGANEGSLDYLYFSGTGDVTFTGAGSIRFNNNIVMSSSSNLVLKGGVSVTAGQAIYASGASGSQIQLNGATLNLYGSSSATVPIDFVEGPVGNTSYNVLAVRSYSTLGHILNLGYGDVISTGDTGSTLVLVANGDGTYSLNNTHNGHYTSTITSYVTLAAGTVVGDFTTSGGSLLYTGPHTCFCAGTYLATPEGEIAVEDIVPGTRLRTASGEVKPVLWVGRSTIATRFADLERALPVRIKAGALGENLPVRDLVVSPCHGLLIDGVLVNAGAIVNGVTIVREHDVPELFTYFHVEFADHEIVLAEGVATESFIDSGERLLFQNWAERADALGDAAVKTELPYPRVKSARQVPAAVRRQIDAQIGGAETGSLAA